MRVLFVDRSTRLETVSDLAAKARGGMVASLFQVSDYLARECDVTVLSDIREPGITPAGAAWVNVPSGAYDVLVANRGVGSGYADIPARRRILWTHDLPHNGFIPEPKTIKAFACTVFMSRYAERVWRTFYRDIGQSEIIPNGVDRELFRPGPKDFGSLIYASAPNRGLDKLPLIFDAIRTRVAKPVRMVAYSNLAALHPGEIGKGDEFDYQSIRESAVELRDPIPQAQLAAELGKAGLMILPSGYPEICSNIVLQALACGVPIVTTGSLGATPEWVNRHNGRLTEFGPQDYMVHTVEIVRHAVDILEDEKLHRRLIRGAQESPVQTWEEIGTRWSKLLRRCS